MRAPQTERHQRPAAKPAGARARATLACIGAALLLSGCYSSTQPFFDESAAAAVIAEGTYCSSGESGRFDVTAEGGGYSVRGAHGATSRLLFHETPLSAFKGAHIAQLCGADNRCSFYAATIPPAGSEPFEVLLIGVDCPENGDEVGAACPAESLSQIRSGFETHPFLSSDAFVLKTGGGDC